MDYEKLALVYVKNYGIVSYKVKGKYLIYNQNYNISSYLGK